MKDDTVNGASFGGAHVALRSMLSDMREATEVQRDSDRDGGRHFTIRAADSSGERSSANVLIDKMYATRGYLTTPLPDEAPAHLITLVASDHDATIGTLTIGFDGAKGLLADELFTQEVQALRDAGKQVCEFTKLAMDSVVRSKRVLATLFNVAYLYAYRIKGVHCLLIEVNPRHTRYYEAMLGFKAIGPKRLNRRVDAPAVLLSLDLAHACEQVRRYGGRPECADTERSLYPYSFSPREEAGILSRLRNGKVDSAHAFTLERIAHSPATPQGPAYNSPIIPPGAKSHRSSWAFAAASRS